MFRQHALQEQIQRQNEEANRRLQMMLERQRMQQNQGGGGMNPMSVIDKFTGAEATPSTTTPGGQPTGGEGSGMGGLLSNPAAWIVTGKQT